MKMEAIRKALSLSELEAWKMNKYVLVILLLGEGVFCIIVTTLITDRIGKLTIAYSQRSFAAIIPDLYM